MDGGENGPIHSAWNVQAWPTTYVLDAQGIVRWRDSSGEDMEAVVDTLLLTMAARAK